MSIGNFFFNDRHNKCSKPWTFVYTLNTRKLIVLMYVEVFDQIFLLKEKCLWHTLYNAGFWLKMKPA